MMFLYFLTFINHNFTQQTSIKVIMSKINNEKGSTESGQAESGRTGLLDQNLSQQNFQQLQKLQIKHQNEVLSTFTNYERLMKETSPGLQLFHQPKRVKQIKYYQIIQQSKRQRFQEAIKANQDFLNQIAIFCEGQERLNAIKQTEISYSNFSKIKTTVKQFYREWSDEGFEVKDYFKVVDKAKIYLKKNDKILAPGSGLGRLVLEFVQAGFSCQGNQVSYFMLYASNFILNGVQQQKQFRIYPFISSSDYYYGEEDIFRSVLIPDKAACKVIPEESDFSMAAGQFTEVYKKAPAQFQGIATCFFIDTANNIFEYVDTIYSTLKQKGIWINYGPLLFHYRQVYNQMSIEVSWQILKAYISDKFQFLEQQFNETSYCHDQRSQMGVTYTCIMFVCKKK